MKEKPVTQFIETHFLHCNAGKINRASQDLYKHIEKGGKLIVTLAGAASSFQIGTLLAPLIRNGKVHAISCTGANFEESFYRHVAHSHYAPIYNYEELTPDEEAKLRDAGKRRITDTFLPEEESVRIIEPHLLRFWKEANEQKKEYMWHEFFWRLFDEDCIPKDPAAKDEDCWVKAAYEKKIPVFIPGYEDSTMGNIFAGYTFEGKINGKYFEPQFDPRIVKSAISYMHSLYDWYSRASTPPGVAFLQLGGGIAEDFPICVVPSLRHDLVTKVPSWAYFCEISSSPMSYGSYSGAGGKEKITWDKLDPETPYFIIQSDYTIVFPLMAAKLLDM